MFRPYKLSKSTAYSRWPAPGKLNRFLHVIGQRKDGYHLIESAFQLIAYHDTVYLKLRSDGKISRSSILPNIAADQDLSVRAAVALKRASSTPWGVDIKIDKRLPIGGGLGGGSSNAATVLMALNQLWRLDYSQVQLQKIGLQLGADIPFFIFGHDAWVEGIGQILSPIYLPNTYFVVIKPRISVSTAEIFQATDLTRNTKPIKIRDFDMATTRNDLESVVCRRYPEIAQAKNWLNQFSPARMTGSGSCIFALFPTFDEANNVIAQLPYNIMGFATRSINKHPLL